MATLDRMSLWGLRNFSPYESEDIKFSPPVTLILGENGCGKTTLIEALKFACSGDLPAGTKGQGFVSDPKLYGVASTKGQVKLCFNDAKGNKYNVAKAMQVIYKTNGLSFKRLDTTLERVSRDGTKFPISSRCADIDKDICEIFGVSKAILNNVIFCHQEDSLWPMDEGKKLKEKFDEIFGAAEYNKAIEILRKQIKERKDKNNKLEANVSMFKQTKEIADKKRDELQEKQEKLDKFLDVIQEKEAKLRPIRNRLQEISVLESDLAKLQQEHTKLETTKSALQNQQVEILKNLDVEFGGTDEELQNEIGAFQRNQSKIKERLKLAEKEKQQRMSEKSQLSSGINKINIKLGKLQGEKKQNQDNINERNNLIRKLAEKLATEIPALDEANDVVAAIETIYKTVEDSKKCLEDLTQEFDNEESRLQKLIDEKRNDLNKVNHTIEIKTQQVKEIKSKNRDINSQLRELDYSDEQLKSLQNKITRIEKDLEACKAAFDANATEGKIESDKQKMRDQEEKIEVLEREYKLLQQNSAVEAECETYRHQLIKRNADFDNLNDKHSEAFAKIFQEQGIPPYGLFKKRLESNKRHHGSFVTDMNKQINLKQKEANTLEVKSRFFKDKLESLEKELQENQKRVTEECKGKRYDTVCKETQQAIEKLQRGKGQYRSAKIMYEKFIQDFQKEKPCCPVCQTDFASKQSAVSEIVTTIKGKIQGIPQELQKVEEELTQKQQQYDKLLQLKPANDKIEILRTNLVPQCQEELNNFKAFHERVKNDIDKLNERIKEPQEIITACDEVIADAALIDQYHIEILQMEKQVKECESRLVKVPSNRSRQQAEAELEELRIDYSTTRRNLDANQKKLQQHNDRCYEYRNEKSKLVDKQLQLQKAMQGKGQLLDQLKELAEKEELYTAEIQELKEQVHPLQRELTDANSTKATVKISNRRKVTEAQDVLNKNQKMLDDTNKLQKLVEGYNAKGGDQVFEATLIELKGADQKLKGAEEAVQKVDNEITEITKQGVSQEGEFRKLKDNLNLRQKRKEEEQLVGQIGEVKKKIGNHDYRTVRQEKERLLAEEEEIRREINTCTGRNDELHQEIKRLNAELSTKYKDASKDYKMIVVEYAVCKKVHEDLQLFTKGLEFGVLKFHQERMKQINKRIRQLWRQIYRGSDCDYVEIKTEETAQTGVRRSYNYRVIQKKGTAEIDMRGRCSAGQKVLASLVIRMALAETFCSKCGILALDEPTTNLDKSNVTSLSETLAKIVEVRQREKSFQLLVITHDEDFINNLRRVGAASSFYRVGRTENGNSVITREAL